MSDKIITAVQERELEWQDADGTVYTALFDMQTGRISRIWRGTEPVKVRCDVFYALQDEVEHYIEREKREYEKAAYEIEHDL